MIAQQSFLLRLLLFGSGKINSLTICRRGDGIDNDALYFVDATNPKLDNLWLVMRTPAEADLTVSHIAVNDKRQVFAAWESVSKFYYVGDELDFSMLGEQIRNSIDEAFGLK